MSTVLALVIITFYLAFTQFLGMLFLKRFERFLQKAKEKLNSPKEVKELKDSDNDMKSELERLKKLLEARDIGEPVMESV